MSFKHAIALMALFPLGGGAAAADLEVSLDGGGWERPSGAEKSGMPALRR